MSREYFSERSRHAARFCLRIGTTLLAFAACRLWHVYAVSDSSGVWASLLVSPGFETSALVAVLATLPFWLSSQSASAEPMAAREVLIWGVFFGLVAALCQNVLRTAAYFSFFKPLPVTFADYFATLPSMTFWLVPCGMLVAFIGLALWILAACRLVRGIDARRFASFTFIFATAVETMGPVVSSFVSPWAMLLAALGLARLVTWRRGALPQHAPLRAAAVAAMLTTALALGVPLVRAVHSASQYSAGTAGKDLPNILLVTLDTVRKESLSLYGYDRATTPQLERLAQRGIVYEQAFAPCSWTLPTHASLFTGILPQEHGADFFQPLRPDFVTLAEILAEAGYATAGFVANCSYCSGRTGLAQGFIHYDDLPWDRRTLLKTSYCAAALCETLFGLRAYDPHRNGEEVSHRFLSWLKHRRDRPFFAFLNYYDAHFPYTIPDRRFDLFATSESNKLLKQLFWKWLAGLPDWSPTDHAEIGCARDAYDGSIRYIDHCLAQVVAGLESAGVIDNTLIVVTNDHGEHFGERGNWLHGSTMYRAVIDAPLMMVLPKKIPAGRRLKQPVSLVQIPATILDLAGISSAARMQPSFAGQWTDDAPAMPIAGYVTVPDRNFAPLWSVIFEGYHYLQWESEQREELYALADGYTERRDLAATQQGKRLLANFRDLLAPLKDARGGLRRQTRPLLVQRTGLMYRCGCGS